MDIKNLNQSANNFINNFRDSLNQAVNEVSKYNYAALTRKDGKKANLSGYEDRMNEAANRIDNSKTVDETMDILKEYANDKDLAQFTILDKSMFSNDIDNAWEPSQFFHDMIGEYITNYNSGKKVDLNEWKKYLSSQIRENLSVPNRSKRTAELKDWAMQNGIGKLNTIDDGSRKF